MRGVCFISRSAIAATLVLCLTACTARGPDETREAAEAPDAAEYAPSKHEFSVMSYNLYRYSVDDRDRDGQRDDPKPLEERQAVLDLIVDFSPDILAVQEMGSPSVFEEFRRDLAQRGLNYDFHEYLRRGDNTWKEINIAVLSRKPIVSHQSHLDDTYTIGDKKKIPVGRGFIDIDIGVSPAYQFRLLVAHLKSKLYNRLGQTEMRRNEARLLNNHVRAALRENDRMNLLVVGDMNDTYGSAAIREVVGKKTPYLFDIRPRDASGDVWTHFRRSHDQYARIDYAFVSQGMKPEVVTSKCTVIEDPRTAIASDHRPLFLVFEARDKSL